MPQAKIEIEKSGFAYIPKALPGPEIFANAYKAYDTVASLMANDELAAITFEKTATDWTKDLRLASKFARAPMGYRDRSIRAEKEKKSYFHYTGLYGDFVRSRYPHFISAYPEIEWLFSTSQILWSAARDVLQSVIEEYDQAFPGIRRLLIHPNASPSVLVRLIRYEPGDHIETTPHYDKSAFTVHMHSDDSAGDQFIIGPWQASELALTDLKPVAARKMSDGSGGAVVFPGMFLKEMGYPEILPSPHAALGSEEIKCRHVSVGFWLVPSMFTDHLVTDIPFRRAA